MQGVSMQVVAVGGVELTPTQLIGIAAFGAVLSAAAVAERKTLHR